MKILVLGAGADSSGGLGAAAREALLALKALGTQVVLLDSNPATLATDLDVAHHTYLEPLTLEAAARILAIERPDAVLATMGGESALALGRQLAAQPGLKLLGAPLEVLTRIEALNAAVDFEAVKGWRQAELLVMMDAQGEAEVVATVEFLEPVGVHPLDSVAVTPAQSFSDAMLQKMHTAALAAVRGLVGVCSVRLAVQQAARDLDPVVLLEVSPGLPSNTALATRASGRKLAAEAAGLLLGAGLRRSGVFSSRPVAVRAPRFDSERFGAAAVPGAASLSTGEVLAFGARFGEALLRAMHALGAELKAVPVATPGPDRWQQVLAGAEGAPYGAWFLAEMKHVAEQVKRLGGFSGLSEVTDATLWMAKTQGFSDQQLATLWKCEEREVRALRHARAVRPSVRQQGELWTLAWDGLATEQPGPQTVLLLGAGARRIGQGGELDWSCAHAARAVKAAGNRVVLLDCTPAACPADFDQVFVGALSLEEVLELCALLKPTGVLTQFGGFASSELASAGVVQPGTSPDDLDCASNRRRFARLVQTLGLAQPPRRFTRTREEAQLAAAELGYPLVARTEQGTVVIHSEAELIAGELESFLAEATEAEVELLRDATGQVLVAGVLEHVEQAGIHSGDAACTLPPHSLSSEVIERLKDAAGSLAEALHVIGLLSVRFAVQGKSVFVLEANLRVSRTTPFVAKATGLQLVELAAQLALGSTLAQQGCTREPALRHVAVKEAVFPFARFPGADVLLGTRMKSTGGVMGLSQSIAEAFGKSQLAAGTALPRGGQVFVSVQNDDKPAVVDLGRRLKAIGFTLLTTEGTHAYLSTKRVESDCVPKVQDGGNHIGERVRTGEIALVINTVDESTQTEEDGFALRREAVTRGVPYFTTVEAARLAVAALEAQATGERQYRPLQDWLAGPQ
jgi:carbamoyl-phosphate synthase large subunit